MDGVQSRSDSWLGFNPRDFNFLLSDVWLGFDSRAEASVFYIWMVVKSVCTCHDLGFDIFRELRTYFGKEFWQSLS